MTDLERRYFELLRRANAASADAIRWGRDPNGVGLAELRRRDAIHLRGMAKALLRA